MTSTCPHCGKLHVGTARFCPISGKSLLSGSGSKGPEIVSVTFADRPVSATSAAPSRPFGLVFIVIYNLFGGVSFTLGALVSLFVLALGSIGVGMVEDLRRELGAEIVGAEAGLLLFGILTELGFFLGIALMSGSIGLWKLYPWGRRIIIWLQVPLIVLNLCTMILLRQAVLIVFSGAIGIVFSLFVMWYLMQKGEDWLFQRA